jgi:autotransporter-associated beta strand protein
MIRSLARSLPVLLPHILRLGAVACLINALPAGAVVMYWDANGSATGTGGAGIWDTSAQTFRSGSGTGALTAWSAATTNTDEAVFAGTAGTVTIANGATLRANRLTFSTDGYTLGGGDAVSNLTLTGSAPTITVGSKFTATLSALLNGSAATLTGGGTLKLGGNERISNSLGLTIAGGSTLDFNNSTETLGAVILASGSLGASMNENGNLTAGSYEVQSGTVTVRLHGTGGLTKTSYGAVTIRGSSDYTGTTLVSDGTLELAGSDSLSKNAALVVDGGTLSLSGLSQTATTVTLRSGSITGTGTLNASDASTPISVYSGSITANLQGTGLTKYGTGTVSIVNQSDLRNGATIVNGGILDLTKATILNTNRVYLNGGTLVASGNQFQNTPFELNGGRLSPAGGLATGTLTTGNETWKNGSGFDFNVWNATGAAGTGYDSLAVGSLDLTALTTGQFDLKVIGLLSATGGAGLVANFNGTTKNGPSYTWTFLTAQNGITGFSAAKFDVDLSAFSNPYTGSFSVVQSGNSLNLVFTPVPEPRTYALLLGLGTLGFIAYRRWRHLHIHA